VTKIERIGYLVLKRSGSRSRGKDEVAIHRGVRWHKGAGEPVMRDRRQTCALRFRQCGVGGHNADGGVGVLRQLGVRDV